jgi:hypothetical protein
VIEVLSASRHSVSKFQLDQAVDVFDRLEVKQACVQEVLARFDNEYKPMASERGLAFVASWCLPPLELVNATSYVFFHWQYPDVAALWRARGSEEADARLPGFWRNLAPLLVSRERHLGRQQRLDIKPLGPPPAFSPPIRGHRLLAFVRPEPPLQDSTPLQWVTAGNDELNYSHAGVNGGGYSRNEGEITWDISAANRLDNTRLIKHLPVPGKLDEVVSLGDCVAYGQSDTSLANGVKRTVLFDLVEGATAENIHNMEKVLSTWGQQLEQMANWRLSRVASTTGDIQWRYCYEQEFTELDVVLGDYLNHPYHWSVADRYFHPESHLQVANRFFHTIKPITESVLNRV